MTRPRKRKSARAWSNEELAILAREWPNGKPIRMWMDLLPKRTERGINMRGLEEHGPRGQTRAPNESVSWRLICAALAGGAALTPIEIAERANVSRRQVYSELRLHRDKVHIASYAPQADSGYRAAQWKLGPGKDARRPAPPTAAEKARKRWKHLKAERPDYIAARLARHRLRHAEKTGKLIRRDPAAAWIA